jgi:hypothetical protein
MKLHGHRSDLVHLGEMVQTNEEQQGNSSNQFDFIQCIWISSMLRLNEQYQTFGPSDDMVISEEAKQMR